MRDQKEWWWQKHGKKEKGVFFLVFIVSSRFHLYMRKTKRRFFLSFFFSSENWAGLSSSFIAFLLWCAAAELKVLHDNLPTVTYKSQRREKKETRVFYTQEGKKKRIGRPLLVKSCISGKNGLHVPPVVSSLYEAEEKKKKTKERLRVNVSLAISFRNYDWWYKYSVSLFFFFSFSRVYAVFLRRVCALFCISVSVWKGLQKRCPIVLKKKKNSAYIYIYIR